MLGSLFAFVSPSAFATAMVSLAAIAPEPAEPTESAAPTEPAEPAEPPADEGAAADLAAPERPYEGPTAAVAGDATEAPVVDATEAEPTEPEPAEPTEPEPTEPEPTKPEPPALATAAPPPVPVYVPPKRRQYPRVIESIVQVRPDERAVFGKKTKFYPGLQVRNQIGFATPFEVDRFGERYEEGAFSTGRIRWSPELHVKKKFKLVAMLDLANGRWAPVGSEDPIIDEIVERGHPPGQTDLRIVDPRELYFEYLFSFGLLRMGQQSFTWGQGILANNGNYQGRFGDMRFGNDGPGDIYERILFGTKPFKYRAGPIQHLLIAVGGDVVFRDERVNLLDKDLAGQALIVVRWQPEKTPWNYLGGYAVYRNQHTSDDGDVYADDDDLEIGAVDIAGQGVKWLSSGLQLIGGFEGVLIAGRTTVARNENGDHKVLQGGAAARGYFGDDPKWLVGFDTGYASGDPDSTDGSINNFTMDAGHTVGLVLFSQVNAWRSAQTEILATNGELSGEPLNGTQFIPTRGGVSNAVYIHPKARYALWEKLEIWGGPLFAAAPAPIIDPYTTRLAGGVATNTVNGDGGKRFYGTELDIGLRGRFDLKNFWLQAGLQGGLLLPGAGLANASGDKDPVAAVWSRLEIRY